MKKSKNLKKERGLKTFLIYVFIVFFIILFSLGIKIVLIAQKSIFDGHSLNLPIAKNDKVVGILGFNIDSSSISLLKIKKGNITTETLGRELGIIPDANISSDNDLSDLSITSLFAKSALKTDSIKTELTIFDIARLFIFSKYVSENDRQVNELDVSKKDYDKNKIINKFFKNDKFVSDGLSIEIINATETSGLGNRLELALTNLGINVISISTAHGKKNNSIIKYYGKNSYTVMKLKSLLKFPIEKLKDKSIADVVIIIGEDTKDTSVF